VPLRSFWKVLIVGACILLGLRASPGTARAEDARPNVVVILTDDMSRWDLAHMPNVQQLLQAQGVTYPDYVTPNPLCAPSRAALLTGLASPHSNVWANNGIHGGYTAFTPFLDDDLPVWLHQAGYETSIDGKFENGFVSTDPVPAGWDDSHILLLADTKSGDGESSKGGYFNYATMDDGAVDQHKAAEADYSTTVLGGDAVSFIQQADPDRPVFVYFTPHAPHLPVTPAPQYVHAAACKRLKSPRTPDYYQIGSDAPSWEQLLAPPMPGHEDGLMVKRCETLLSVDDEVGAIVQTLRDTGRLADTLIVFTSDNGYSLGQHDWEGKLTPYPESDTLPLVVRWDARPFLAAGSSSSQLVETMDLPVAIADAAGAATPASDGEDFLFGPPRTSAPIEHALQKEKVVPDYCGIIEDGMRYALYQDGSQDLYDLTADPYELDNLANSEPYTAAQLRTDALTACTPRPPGWPRRLG